MGDVRIGVLVPRDVPAHRFVEYVRRAEGCGFTDLWVVEDCGFGGGVAQAATALAHTREARVGIGILPAPARSPVYAAMEIATLAELYPGRVSLGVGHGMPTWMRQVGLACASPMTLLTETLDCLRRLLHGETLTTTGRYVRLVDMALDRVPDVPPPVLAGVRGKKSLQLSGRLADGTLLAEPVTPAYVAAAKRQIAADDHLLIGYNLAAIDATSGEDQRLREMVAGFGDPDWAPHIEPLDFAPQFARLRAACASQAEFAARMPQEWVTELTLSGPAAECRDRLARLLEADLDQAVMIPVAADPIESLDRLRRST